MTCHQVAAHALLPSSPRRIDPGQVFENLVSWIESMARHRGAPGLLVGISGTDSILVLLACAQAFQRMARPGRVLGVHYGQAWPPPGRTHEQAARMVELAPRVAWVQRTLMPWLASQVPDVQLCVDSTAGNSDHARWAAMIARSLDGAPANEPLQADGTYWVVGTRNATESALLTYSNLSRAASVQPLLELWKSEVIEVCTHLDVPRIAIEQSRQADCDCGRFDIAAANIEAVDAILMVRTGVLDAQYLERNIEPGLLATLNAYVDEQMAAGSFKLAIPYSPQPGSLVR